MLAYSIHEKEWKDPQIQFLATSNEFFVYAMLVLINASACHDELSSFSSNCLGWAIIAVVTLAIFVNITVMTVQACSHCKLLYTRYLNKQAQISKKNKISPLAPATPPNKTEKPVDAQDRQIRQVASTAQMLPEPIEEVSSMNEESLGIVGLPQPDSSVELPELLRPMSFKKVEPAEQILPELQEQQEMPKQNELFIEELTPVENPEPVEASPVEATPAQVKPAKTMAADSKQKRSINIFRNMNKKQSSDSAAAKKDEIIIKAQVL